MSDATPNTMPWTVIIYPPWYDDEDDHGYGWAGEATDEKDAVRQACEQCLLDNDVEEWATEPDDYKLDPETVDYSDAHYDYRVLYERLKTEAMVLAALMDDAITTHIYDERNGDVIPDDCAYMRAVEAVREAAKA